MGAQKNRLNEMDLSNTQNARVYLKLLFPSLNNNISCGCSKELSQWDGSFEDSKQTYIEGAEKNPLNEKPPSNTQNTSLNWWVIG